MTQLLGRARGPALAAFAACAIGCLVVAWSTPSEAKKSKASAQPAQSSQAQQSGPAAPGEDGAKAQATAARQAYDAGLKSFANGKFQPSVDLLSTALKGGGLGSGEMAKALYTRGLAYKKLKKPSLAISDLTSALWLKNGLSGGDREAATAERSEAYKLAGIEDAGSGGERVVVADPNPNSNAAGLSAAAVAEAAGGNTAPITASPGTAAQVTRQDPSSVAAQDAARAREAAAQVPDNSLQSVASAPVASVGSGGADSVPATSAGFVSPAQASEAAPTASPVSTVTGFFSNLFGGGSSASPPAGAPAGSVTTASTAPAAAVAPETSSWSSGTVVTAGATKTKPHTETAALAVPVKTKVPKAGKYKVHIAALRSRADAEALAQQLVAQHGSELGDRTPSVDEAVIGSMGTFYRVRVGGYASQDEPRSLCNKLRSSGLDCLVVTN